MVWVELKGGWDIVGLKVGDYACGHGNICVYRISCACRHYQIRPVRRVLLDAMRPTIEEDVGVPVQFVVDTLRVEDGWAYFAGTPQQKNGEPIDFEQTRYAEAIAEGFFDGPFLQAVLEKVDGEWLVVVFDIGATDVVAIGWPDEFGVPCAVVEQC
jgi:hypothetical protein